METMIVEVKLPAQGEWAPANHNWLSQYLLPSEIEKYFYYAPSEKRHIYYSTEPYSGELFFEARSVKEKPKVLSFGEKPYTLLGNYSESGVVVVVEDIVSAIKVGRNYGALPLFGSAFPPDWMARLSRNLRVRRTVIWLDYDKYDLAVDYARKLQLLKKTGVILTEDDPKELDDLTIIRQVQSTV
jgi:hypothetical protein